MDDADRSPLLSGAAAFLDLRIDPEMQAGIAANLALLHQHAARVMDFALTEADEIAPVFRP